MSALPTLWGNTLCPYVDRARIIFARAGVDYAFKLVDLTKKPKGLLDISPYGKVPVLEVSEGVIWESAAINQYIDEKYAGGKIMGSDPYKRALHRVWTHWCNTRFSSAVYGALFNQDRAKDAELLHKVDGALEFLETRLPAMQGKGPFMLGHEYQFADIMTHPFLLRLQLLQHFRGYSGPSASKFPHVARLSEACSTELAKLPVKDVPITAEALIKGYEPYVTGKVPIHPSIWSY